MGQELRQMATVAESMSEFKSDVDVNNLPDRISQAVLSRARRQPSHPCLVDSERTLDYAGLVSAIEECKTFLTSHQVGPGDRVLLIAENSITLVAFMIERILYDAVITLKVFTKIK